MITILNWLVELKNKNKIMIWLFSEECIDDEQFILINFGVDNVVCHNVNFKIFCGFVSNNLEKNIYFRETRNTGFLNKNNDCVKINGVDLGLIKKEFELIYLLSENKNNTVSYENIMKELWAKELYNNYYILSNLVCLFRKKVHESKNFKILTVRSKGYMLIENEKNT